MTSSLVLDYRGLSCPEPALRTQRELEKRSGGAVEILVDSGTARDNVARTARRLGWQAAVTDMPGGYRLTLTK